MTRTAAPLDWTARPDRAPDRRAAVGRAGGLVQLIGALFAIPVTVLLHTPHTDARAWGAILLMTVTGSACLLVPWQRLAASAVNVAAAIATLEIALAVQALGDHGIVFAWLYVLVALYVALALRDRRAIVGQVALLCLAFTVPLFDLDSSSLFARTIVGLPVLIVVVVAVVLMREAMEKEERRLQNLTLHDELTGLGNERLLARRLDAALTWHRERSVPFALLLLEIDGGGPSQDRAESEQRLAAVARALAGTVRGSDVLVRRRDEAFAILLPGTDDALAGRLADRVDDALMPDLLEPPSGVSIGWAIFPDEGETGAELVATAEQALRRDRLDRRRQATLHLVPDYPEAEASSL